MSAQTSGKGRSLRFRELVLLTLRVAGIEGIAQKKEFKKLSARLLADEDHSDIQGLDQWSLVTRNEVSPRDLSGGLDEAVREARLDGKPKAAAIWYRPGREASESFVVMTLGTFADVLREEQERASS